MKVYIQSNKKQHVAAKVSQFTFKKFNLDAEIVLIEECDFFKEIINKTHLRNGKKTIFKDDLQSFTLLRFYISTIHKGSEDYLIVDPDVFALKDPKISRNLTKKKNSLLCTFYKNKPRSEVMYFDQVEECWNFDQIIKDLLDFKLDYKDLINLNFKNQNLNISEIEKIYNEHDVIKPETVLLHTTKRITQPWKLNLEIDFERNISKKNIFINRIKKFLKLKYNEEFLSKNYLMHDNQDVFKFVAKIFLEAINQGAISKSEIEESISNKYLSQKFIDYVYSENNK